MGESDLELARFDFRILYSVAGGQTKGCTLQVFDGRVHQRCSVSGVVYSQALILFYEKEIPDRSGRISSCYHPTGYGVISCAINQPGSYQFNGQFIQKGLE